MRAAILAGGYGKRLRPLTEKVPKPLLEVAGKPILRWQIDWLYRHGVREFVLCIGYLREKIMQYMESLSDLKIEVYYSVETEPLGTGGAIKRAEEFLRSEDVFFVLNGDVITNLNPTLLLDRIDDAVGALALVQLRSPYGVVETDGEGRITAFREKPLLKNYWINAGVYCFRPEIFDYLPERGDIERTSFLTLSEHRKLASVKFVDVYWRSVDTYKDLEAVSRELPEVVW